MKIACVTVLSVFCVLSAPVLSLHEERFDTAAFLKHNFENTFQGRAGGDYVVECQEYYQPKINECNDRLNTNILGCTSDRDNAAEKISEALQPAKEENDQQSALIQAALESCNDIEDLDEYFDCHIGVGNDNALRSIQMGGKCKESVDEIARRTDDIKKDYDECNSKSVKQSQVEINEIMFDWMVCNLNGVPTPSPPTTTTEEPETTTTEEPETTTEEPETTTEEPETTTEEPETTTEEPETTTEEPETTTEEPETTTEEPETTTEEPETTTEEPETTTEEPETTTEEPETTTEEPESTTEEPETTTEEPETTTEEPETTTEEPETTTEDPEPTLDDKQPEEDLSKFHRYFRKMRF